MHLPQQQHDVATVVKVLSDLDDLMQNTTQRMFLDAISHAKGDDPMQTKFCGFVRDTLHSASSTFNEQQSNAGRDASIEQEEVTTRQKLVDEAVADEAAKAKLAQEAKDAVAEISKQVKEAEQEHKNFKQKCENMTKVWDSIREDCSRGRSIAEGSLQLLVDGGWSDDEVRDAAVEAVVEYLAEVHSEKALVAAAKHALSTKPEDRVAFDAFTVDATVERIKQILKEKEARLADVEPEETETRAELLGLWAIADVARDSAVNATVAQATADGEALEASEAVRCASKRLCEQEVLIDASAKKRLRLEERRKMVDEAITAIERMVAHQYNAGDVPEMAAAQGA